MTQTPDEVFMTPQGGLTCGNWPKAELVKFIRATPAREAADDMLAALEATRLVLAEHEPHPLPVLAQVLAAIAKAKGTH